MLNHNYAHPNPSPNEPHVPDKWVQGQSTGEYASLAQPDLLLESENSTTSVGNAPAFTPNTITTKSRSPKSSTYKGFKAYKAQVNRGQRARSAKQVQSFKRNQTLKQVQSIQQLPQAQLVQPVNPAQSMQPGQFAQQDQAILQEGQSIQGVQGNAVGMPVSLAKSVPLPLFTQVMQGTHTDYPLPSNLRANSKRSPKCSTSRLNQAPAQTQVQNQVKPYLQAQAQIQLQVKGQTQLQVQSQSQLQFQPQGVVQVPPHSQLQAKSKTNLSTQPQFLALSHTLTPAQSHFYPQNQTQPQARSQIQPHSQPQFQALPQVPVQSHNLNKAYYQTQTKVLAQASVCSPSQLTAPVQGQPQPQSQPLSQPQGQAQVLSNHQGTCQPQAQSKSQSLSQSQSHYQAQDQIQAQIQTQSHAQPQPRQLAQAQSQPHPQSQVQAQAQPQAKPAAWDRSNMQASAKRYKDSWEVSFKSKYSRKGKSNSKSTGNGNRKQYRGGQQKQAKVESALKPASNPSSIPVSVSATVPAAVPGPELPPMLQIFRRKHLFPLVVKAQSNRVETDGFESEGVEPKGESAQATKASLVLEQPQAMSQALAKGQFQPQAQALTLTQAQGQIQGQSQTLDKAQVQGQSQFQAHGQFLSQSLGQPQALPQAQAQVRGKVEGGGCQPGRCELPKQPEQIGKTNRQALQPLQSLQPSQSLLSTSQLSLSTPDLTPALTQSLPQSLTQASTQASDQAQAHNLLQAVMPPAYPSLALEIERDIAIEQQLRESGGKHVKTFRQFAVRLRGVDEDDLKSRSANLPKVQTLWSKTGKYQAWLEVKEDFAKNLSIDPAFGFSVGSNGRLSTSPLELVLTKEFASLISLVWSVKHIEVQTYSLEGVNLNFNVTLPALKAKVSLTNLPDLPEPLVLSPQELSSALHHGQLALSSITTFPDMTAYHDIAACHELTTSSLTLVPRAGLNLQNRTVPWCPNWFELESLTSYPLVKVLDSYINFISNLKTVEALVDEASNQDASWSFTQTNVTHVKLTQVKVTQVKVSQAQAKAFSDKLIQAEVTQAQVTQFKVNHINAQAQITSAQPLSDSLIHAVPQYAITLDELTQNQLSLDELTQNELPQGNVTQNGGVKNGLTQENKLSQDEVAQNELSKRDITQDEFVLDALALKLTHIGKAQNVWLNATLWSIPQLSQSQIDGTSPQLIIQPVIQPAYAEDSSLTCDEAVPEGLHPALRSSDGAIESIAIGSNVSQDAFEISLARECQVQFHPQAYAEYQSQAKGQSQAQAKYQAQAKGQAQANVQIKPGTGQGVGGKTRPGYPATFNLLVEKRLFDKHILSIQLCLEPDPGLMLIPSYASKAYDSLNESQVVLGLSGARTLNFKLLDCAKLRWDVFYPLELIPVSALDKLDRLDSLDRLDDLEQRQIWGDLGSSVAQFQSSAITQGSLLSGYLPWRNVPVQPYYQDEKAHMVRALLRLVHGDRAHGDRWVPKANLLPQPALPPQHLTKTVGKAGIGKIETVGAMGIGCIDGIERIGGIEGIERIGGIEAHKLTQNATAKVPGAQISLLPDERAKAYYQLPQPLSQQCSQPLFNQLSRPYLQPIRSFESSFSPIVNVPQCQPGLSRLISQPISQPRMRQAYLNDYSKRFDLKPKVPQGIAAFTKRVDDDDLPSNFMDLSFQEQIDWLFKHQQAGLQPVKIKLQGNWPEQMAKPQLPAFTQAQAHAKAQAQTQAQPPAQAQPQSQTKTQVQAQAQALTQAQSLAASTLNQTSDSDRIAVLAQSSLVAGSPRQSEQAMVKGQIEPKAEPKAEPEVESAYEHEAKHEAEHDARALLKREYEQALVSYSGLGLEHGSWLVKNTACGLQISPPFYPGLYSVLYPAFYSALQAEHDYAPLNSALSSATDLASLASYAAPRHFVKCREPSLPLTSTQAEIEPVPWGKLFNLSGEIFASPALPSFIPLTYDQYWPPQSPSLHGSTDSWLIEPPIEPQIEFQLASNLMFQPKSQLEIQLETRIGVEHEFGRGHEHEFEFKQAAEAESALEGRMQADEGQLTQINQAELVLGASQTLSATVHELEPYGVDGKGGLNLSHGSGFEQTLIYMPELKHFKVSTVMDNLQPVWPLIEGATLTLGKF